MSADLPPPGLTGALRSALASLRPAPPLPVAPAPFLAAPDPAPPAVPAAPVAPASEAACWRRAINATGAVFDRALGSPPLADAAIAAMRDAARAGVGADDPALLLAALTGAERVLVLGDALSGLAMALLALAGTGGEIVVSRGDLFEHDQVRIPDLVGEIGAQLFEVGSIERTIAADFRAAITPATRVLLKLHRPHAIGGGGGGDEVSIREMAAIGRPHGIRVVHALGSGGLMDGFGERGIRGLLADGADLAVFSAGVLLGGPRAGILAGRDAVLGPIGQQAIVRASLPDRPMLAALAATLALHRDPEQAKRLVPALRLLDQDRLVVEERATRLLGLLGFVDAAMVRSTPLAGGGLRPGQPLESRAVSIGIPALTGEEAAARLRAGSPAIVARAAEPRVLLDAFALADHELGEVADAVRRLVT